MRGGVVGEMAAVSASHLPVRPLQWHGMVGGGGVCSGHVAFVPGRCPWPAASVHPSHPRSFHSYPRSSHSYCEKPLGAAWAGWGSAAATARASIMIGSRVRPCLRRVILAPFLRAAGGLGGSPLAP